MAVRTAVLVLSETTAPAGSRTLAKVPAGRTWLIREITVSPTSAGPHQVELYLLRGSQASLVFTRSAAQPFSFNIDQGRHLVLQAGDELVLYTTGSANPTVRVGVFGSNLLGVAD